jgi:hypothetical protein
MLPTEFEVEVTRLGLTKSQLVASTDLKRWCERNRNRVYIPEWLLVEWGMRMDVSFAAWPVSPCTGDPDYRSSLRRLALEIDPENRPAHKLIAEMAPVEFSSSTGELTRQGNVNSLQPQPWRELTWSFSE